MRIMVKNLSLFSKLSISLYFWCYLPTTGVICYTNNLLLLFTFIIYGLFCGQQKQNKKNHTFTVILQVQRMYFKRKRMPLKVQRKREWERVCKGKRVCFLYVCYCYYYNSVGVYYLKENVCACDVCFFFGNG